MQYFKKEFIKFVSNTNIPKDKICFVRLCFHYPNNNKNI